VYKKLAKRFAKVRSNSLLIMPAEQQQLVVPAEQLATVYGVLQTQ
jgi:hypothetical protein